MKFLLFMFGPFFPITVLLVAIAYSALVYYMFPPSVSIDVAKISETETCQKAVGKVKTP